MQELTQLINRGYLSIDSREFRLEGADQTVDRTTQRVERGECFVAVVDGQLVGTLTVSAGFENPACPYLGLPNVACYYQWAVEPALQGLGIGFGLWRACEHWAADLGFTELVGHTAEGHLKQIGYLKRLGCLEVDRIRWPSDSYMSLVFAKKLQTEVSP